MPGLDRGDASALLLDYAAPGCDIQSLAVSQRVAVDRAPQGCSMTKGPICGAGSEKQCVPLALKELGRQLQVPLYGPTSELTRFNDPLVVQDSLLRTYVSNIKIFVHSGSLT